MKPAIALVAMVLGAAPVAAQPAIEQLTGSETVRCAGPCLAGEMGAIVLPYSIDVPQQAEALAAFECALLIVGADPSEALRLFVHGNRVLQVADPEENLDLLDSEELRQQLLDTRRDREMRILKFQRRGCGWLGRDRRASIAE